MGASAMLIAAAPASAAVAALTLGSTAVTRSSVTLQGQVTPVGDSTTYYFDYGPTTAYGHQTPATLVPSTSGVQNVQVAVAGLTPGTLYHYRLTAGKPAQVAVGLDQTFRTAAGTGPEPNPTGSATGPLGDPLGGLTDRAGAGGGSGAGPAPVLGQTLGAGPASGTVLIKLPGGAGFAPLAGDAPVPVGTTVDATHGTVNLVTAAGDSGQTQAAQFRGGVFQVRQRSAGGGMTDIVLRGGNFGVCRAAGARHARSGVGAARAPRTVRRLWGRDSHGRFRTHGSHAIATVRGTEWVVTDRCDGTLTRVARGAVSVRDQTLRKTVLVKAGHSYLAPARAR